MKRFFKRLLKIVSIALGVLLMICIIVFKTPLLLADIRPSQLKKQEVPTNNGRALLEESQRAHGMEFWSQRDSLTYLVDQEFTVGISKWLISPVDQMNIQYHYTSYPKDYAKSYYASANHGNEAMNFKVGNGTKGIYKCFLEGDSTFNGYSTEFFYKGMRHLIEFPFEMSSATIVENIGTANWNDQEYELLFATWNELNPSMEVDQYIIWVNKRTKRMDRFDATGRIMTPFARAMVTFEYNDAKEGIVVPKSISVSRIMNGAKEIMKLEPHLISRGSVDVQ